MATIGLTTFKDMIDHLVAYLGDNATKDAVRDVKRAAIDGYRELTTSHRWSYFFQRGRISTVASYTTGTIAYDHTGGTYENEITLTSGTWPSWANLGQIVISDIVYQVSERKSDTVITLLATSNPGADVDAGTTYTLYRDTYALPCDFQSMDTIQLVNFWPLVFVHPREWLERQRVYQSPSSPRFCSIVGSPDHFGAMALGLYPAPDSAQAIDFIYHRRPRPLVVDEQKAGTVTLAADSTTLTGSGTAFSSSMVGSVIRLSSSTTDHPTGISGNNSYAIERTIVAVASATSLTIDSSSSTGYTAVKYVISDPVDIEEGAMMTALLRCCEKQTAIGRIMKNMANAAAAYRESLVQAREADSRWQGLRAYGGRNQYLRLRDYPSGSDST